MKKLFIVLVSCIFILTGCAKKDIPGEKTGSFVSFYTENYADHLEQLADNVFLDISTIEDGYFAVVVDDASKAYKVQLTLNGEKYYFNVKNDGSKNFYTFAYGNGEYKISVMKNSTDSKYVSVGSRKVQVDLKDEFQPFIRSNSNVQYNIDSEVVAVATSLAKKCDTDADFLEAVYSAICDQLRYDNQKAENLEKGYVPDPDVSWKSKKGICYDYAVIAATMLRSQGVPCKVIAGYVNGDYYHAWNVVYLANEGWVVYTYSLQSKSWSRVDLTFEDQMVTKDYLKYDYVDCYYY